MFWGENSSLLSSRSPNRQETILLPPLHIPPPFHSLTELKYSQISVQNTFNLTLVSEVPSSHFTDQYMEARGGTTRPRSRLIRR